MIIEENDTDSSQFYETPITVEILHVCNLCEIEVSTLGIVSELDTETHEASFSWPPFSLIPVETNGFLLT